MAKNYMLKKYSGQKFTVYLIFKNSAHASLTLVNCKKEAPIMIDWTFLFDIVTFPVYAKFMRVSKALKNIYAYHIKYKLILWISRLVLYKKLD